MLSEPIRFTNRNQRKISTIMNRIAFRHSLRGRMLLYLVLPMLVISIVIIAFSAVHSLGLVRKQAQLQLRSLAEQVALEVEQSNMQLISC